MDRGRRPEAGFSMVELVVAMAVTLIVSGAIFGLMSAGQNAFRREPELMDRQQNIRVAMKLIETDVANAGMAMPSFLRVFTPGLDAQGPTGPSGAKSDFLQVYGNDGLCPGLVVTGTGESQTSASIFTRSSVPACFQLPGMVMFTSAPNTEWAIRWACEHKDSGTKGHLTIPAGSNPIYNSPGGLGFLATTAAAIQMVRYEIRIDAENVPNLWRSPTGGLVPPNDGQCKAAAVVASDGYLLLARGIEDLQVRYRTNAGWADAPPAAIATIDNIVREVRVTLSSRVLTANLAGQSTSAIGSAIRGQLTSTVSPRAALQALTAASPAPQQWQ